MAAGEFSRESNPCVTFHCPDGTLRPLASSWQGGGLYVYGTATLTNTNVYSNTAQQQGANMYIYGELMLLGSALADFTGIFKHSAGSVVELEAPPPTPPPPASTCCERVGCVDVSSFGRTCADFEETRCHTRCQPGPEPPGLYPVPDADPNSNFNTNPNQLSSRAAMPLEQHERRLRLKRRLPAAATVAVAATVAASGHAAAVAGPAAACRAAARCLCQLVRHGGRRPVR